MKGENMWYTILQRLKSPVVIGAVILAGFNFASELTGADFSGFIIEDLERKVRLRDQYKRTLTNTELAMM